MLFLRNIADMTLDKKRLEALQKKITMTWKLLDIDLMVAQMRGAEQEMQAGDFWSNQENATKVSKFYEDLKSEIAIWTGLRDEVVELISLAETIESEGDENLAQEIEIRVAEIEKEFEKQEFYLLFGEKYDKNNAILSIYAGSGGTEAQDWAEMLLRMVLRYAEKKGWKVTLLEESKGSEAGIKSVMLRLVGRYAYGHLQSEHGTHRLVRISPFDAEKMRHTSFANIEVIPEIESAQTLEINDKDLRIDTYMAGGKGGQSVNTTYSAVRVVHIPTGITVQCQNERSQLQNKETAMKVLYSKLLQKQEEEEKKERDKLRGEYKSAEWGNQIRNYVLHPYKMVKDVRTKFETQDTESVLGGEIDGFVESFLRWKKENQK